MAVDPTLPASLKAELNDLKRRLANLERSPRLATATVGSGGLKSADFDGDLESGTAGTAGWGLSGATGDAIFNDIVLRGGIIGDDALTSPVKPIAVNASNYSAGTPSSPTPWVTDVVVPAGFTTASVILNGAYGAQKNTAAWGALTLQIGVYDDGPNDFSLSAEQAGTSTALDPVSVKQTAAWVVPNITGNLHIVCLYWASGTWNSPGLLANALVLFSR